MSSDYDIAHQHANGSRAASSQGYSEASVVTKQRSAKGSRAASSQDHSEAPVPTKQRSAKGSSVASSQDHEPPTEDQLFAEHIIQRLRNTESTPFKETPHTNCGQGLRPSGPTVVCSPTPTLPVNRFKT